MATPAAALSALPVALRDPLLSEYQGIIQSYFEHRWSPTELSGGRFCEVVYWILHGYAAGNFVAAPSKPANMTDACKRLESNTNVPRSFQILIPRLLPALYEIRNNRGVGHVGGDVDPNHMDATAVVSIVNWIMAELVRVFHALTSTEDAQRVVDALAERRIPMVWQMGNIKRVLDPSLKLEDQVLLLISSASDAVPIESLFGWLDSADRPYFNRLLRNLHKGRFLDLNGQAGTVEILPPGSHRVSALTGQRASGAQPVMGRRRRVRRR